jgi:hypothetical protein
MAEQLGLAELFCWCLKSLALGFSSSELSKYSSTLDAHGLGVLHQELAAECSGVSRTF